MIYIIGHTTPDLDSAVSVICLKYLFDRAGCFNLKNAKPVLAGEANYETKTIFAKYETKLPLVLTNDKIKPDDTFVLVDHNEADQRLEAIKDHQISNIFDHHKVNLNLSLPIFITIKPWGSINTLVWWLMDICQLKPTKNLASLMVSAILSDTVGLKSATTTKKDKEVLERLNKIAKIGNKKEIDKLTFEIFKAKSDLSGLTNRQILTKDYKIYDFKGKKVLINQVETVEQDKVVAMAKPLTAQLEQLTKEMKLNQAVCVITDVIKQNSQVLVPPLAEAMLKKAFPKGKKIKDGVYDIGPLMSRKKEIAPAIEKAI